MEVFQHLSEITIGEIKEIEVENILPIPEEIRTMTPDEFNLLCQSLRENGYVEPIQVIEDGEGKYRIVNGMHRFQALKEVFEWKKIPCIVIGKMGDGKWDETKYWTEVIRLNNIRGKFDLVALSKKVMELREKTKDLYDVDELKRKLGFAGSKTTFDKIIGQVEKSLPPELAKKLRKSKKEIETMEDLSVVLNGLMKQYGKTLENNFLLFSWGGKDVLMVKCSNKLWSELEKLKDEVVNKNLDMTKVFEKIVGEYLGFTD